MTLSIAVAQPRCIPGNLAANVAAHTAAIEAAAARVVVFPELSLTGYQLDASPLGPDDAALAPIVDACARTRSIAFVGAPVHASRGRHIATLAVSSDGCTLAYAKGHLGGDETHGFRPGTGPASVVVDGWRLGLGICKDTGVPAHVDETLALGIDLYAAGLVHHPSELGDQDARAARIVELGAVPVAFASAAGPVGADYPQTAGHSCIWAGDGSVLARAGADADDIACAVLLGSQVR